MYRRLLLQHPQAISKLRREIKDALGVGPEAPEPTIAQLKKLSYLSNVIKEGILFYLPVFLDFRVQP